MYLPIVVMVGISVVLVLLMIGMSLVLGPRSYSHNKFEPYECGVDPTPVPASGARFPIKYYILAMIFIVFDIEIIFMYPWAVSFGSLGVIGMVEMVLFMVTLLVAYAYVWRRGGLDWE